MTAEEIVAKTTSATVSAAHNVRRRLSQILQDMPKRYSFEKPSPKYTYLANDASSSSDEGEFKQKPDLGPKEIKTEHKKSIWAGETWRHEKQRLVVILLTFLIFAISLFLLWAYVDHLDPNKTKPDVHTNVKSLDSKSNDLHTSGVCLTPACVRVAAHLLDSIDFSKNPCENFYEYSCGLWKKNNPIPDDRPKIGAFTKVDELVKQQLKGLLEDTGTKSSSKMIEFVKQFFAKCVDTKTINEVKSLPLQKMIRDFGGWPILDRNWQGAKIDLTEIWGRMFKVYSKDAFLKIYISPDTKNMPKMIMLLDQGDMGLGPFTREYYLNETGFASQIDAYKKLMADYITIIASDMQISLSQEQLKKDIEEIVAFERQLANITFAEENRRNSSLLYNKWTMGRLQKTLTLIDWNKLLKLIMPKEVYTRLIQNNFDNYEFLLTEPEFVKNLNELLLATDKKILVNFMIWVTVKESSQSLDSRFEEAEQAFKLAYMGRTQKPMRWKKCVAYCLVLDMASGAMYIREYFSQNDKIEALDMISYLKEAFTEIVDHLDWMDPETKKSAYEKVGHIYNKIGYPNFITNDTDLDNFYKNLTLDTKDATFFDIDKRVSSWYQDKDWYDLLKTFDRFKFNMNPATVNAFYSAEMNAITFPAGILQPPFFHGDFPKYVNFGAMGSVIGHEITHGFDDQGSQFDKNGYLKNWWSAEAEAKFSAKKQCIIDQYSDFVVPGIHKHVNGKQTQGENIADNGGLKEAHLAYRKYIKKLGHEELRLPGLNLTNDQIFFLSFSQFWCSNAKPAALVLQILTDGHSPEMFRVIGTLRNSKAFSQSFQCKPGSLMNPTKKCSVW